MPNYTFVKSIILKFTATSKPGYALLLVMFSCALMIDIGCRTWYYNKVAAFITLMVCLQYANYRFWWATYGAMGAAAAIMLQKFPRLPNHSNLEFILFFIFAGLLACRVFFKAKLPPPHTVNLTFRLFLISVYFIAGFHKLNSGFINIDGSCAESIGYEFNSLLYGQNYKLHHTLLKAFQAGTFLIEMVVPFGLLFKSSRTISVLLLISFHFFMSLYGFANFSAFAAFLITGSILNLEQEFITPGIIKGLRLYIMFAILAVLGCYFIARFYPGRLLLIKIYGGAVFNMGWVLYFYYLIRHNKNIRLPSTFSWWQPATVLLVSLWGLQCYAGLGNTGNLTMFSNLITLKSRSNHFIVNTQKTKIWHFEEDYVTIIDIPGKCKGQNGKNLKGYILPLIEFKTSVKKWSARYKEALPCILEYKNKRVVIPNLSASEYNKTEWWYRYLSYRRIPVKGNECQW